MFKIVEGPVPEGDIGRVDLWVSRDATTGEVVGNWDDVIKGPARRDNRVRRVSRETQSVAQAYKDAVTFAKKHEISLCIHDSNKLFPLGDRP